MSLAAPREPATAKDPEPRRASSVPGQFIRPLSNLQERLIDLQASEPKVLLG